MILGAGALLVVGALLGAAGQAALSEDEPFVHAQALPGEVDVGFSQDMVVHHQQAVDMVRLLRDRGGARVGSVAAAIEASQLSEIGMLGGWLALWRAAPVTSGSPMDWMPPHAGSAHSAMPGMAAPGDLDRLATLKGSALTRHFLKVMIRHHEGGLEMAAYAKTHALTDTVRAAAARMLVEEREQISLMRQLLAMPASAAT